MVPDLPDPPGWTAAQETPTGRRPPIPAETPHIVTVSCTWSPYTFRREGILDPQEKLEVPSFALLRRCQ